MRPEERPHTVVQVVIDLHAGGLETLCVDLSAGFVEEGIRSVVVALDGGGSLVDRLATSGVEYVSLGGRRPYSPAFHAGYWRTLRRIAPDVVHTHHFSPLLYTVPSRLAARVPRHLHTEHSYEYLEHRPYLRRPFRALARTCDGVVVLGSNMRRFYEAEIGIAPSRLRVIPNGVNTDHFQPPLDRVAARRHLGWASGPTLGTVCRLSPEKNLGMLLRAFAVIAAEQASVSLVIAGDGPERARLEKLINDLELRQRVHLLGWQADVRSVLHCLDVFCITSDVEGLPLALLEAMASGCAVIGTRVGDIADVIQDGRNGFVLAAGDEASLVDHLRHLLARPSLVRAMGESARRIAYERFSRSAMIDSYLRAYTGLDAPAETQPVSERDVSHAV